MPELTIEGWDVTRQAWASQALLQVYPGGLEVNGKAVYSKGLWADIVVHMMIGATHLAWVARAAEVIRAEGGEVHPLNPTMARVLTDPSFFAGKKIGDPTYHRLASGSSLTVEPSEVWSQLNLRDAGLLIYATEACCNKIYRTALRTRLPAIEVFPVEPPGEAALGLPPIVIGAIVVVAIAALVSGAWLGSEISADLAEVDIETARASSESQLAIEIAKAQIASGLPVALPENLMSWGKRQKTLTDPWFKVAAGVGIVGAGAAGAAAGYKLRSGA